MSGFLLQNVTILLQNATVITKCDNFVANCNSYYKMRRCIIEALLQLREAIPSIRASTKICR